VHVRIWKIPMTVEFLNQVSENTAVSYLGIAFLEIGDDWVTGTARAVHIGRTNTSLNTTMGAPS
jgi:hypothetical protein